MARRQDIQARLDRLSPEQRTRLEQRLRGEVDIAGIVPRGEVEAPLSYPQQGIRFLLQVFGDHDAFWNQSSSLRLRGPLDLAALERALSEIEARHEALRTTVSEGWPGAQVVQPPRPVELDVVDASASGQAEADVIRRALEDRTQPFDIRTGPVWRCHLYRLAADDHVLLVVSDHLISDPWSHGVIAREVSALYTAFVRDEPSPLPPVALQYGDYAVWERDWLTGAELERQRDYWTGQFDGLQSFQVPTDRPAERTWTTTGYSEPVVLDFDLSAAVRALSRDLNVTPSMTLLGAFKAVLALESGAEEVVLATFNLNRTRPELEGVVGLFSNMLVLRTDCAGDPTFATLLDRVRGVVLGALAHAELPVDQLISIPGAMDAINRDRQDWIVYQFFNLSASSLDVPGLDVTPFELRADGSETEESGTGPIDLHLVMSERDGLFTGSLTYNAEIFSRPRIAELLTRVRRVLAAGVADPDRRLSSLLAEA